MLKNIFVTILFFIIPFTFNATDLNQHPLMKNNDNKQLLFDLAQRLSDNIDAKYKKKYQVILGLGQSPAYLIALLKMIDKQKQRTGRTYKHVAFSGKFYNKLTERKRKYTSDDLSIRDTFDQLCKDHPAEFDASCTAKITALQPIYQTYLDAVGLSEQALADKTIKFILVDRCISGFGIRSFLYMIRHYRRQPKIFFLYDYSCSPYQGLQAIQLDKPTTELLVALKNCEKHNDRLVQHYEYTAWRDVDPLLFKKSENAKKILKALKRFIIGHIC